MKNRFLVLALLGGVIIMSGCTKNSPTSPNQETVKNGSVSLAFDKTTAPQNVVNIIAYLTRANYDTLKGDLNLLSTSSADIKINDIPVGTWHLKVDAMNADSTVVYSGESDVQINEGVVSQVNLTLIPTGNGQGSIYILVNWGKELSNFTDYIMNPIFTPSQNPTLPNGVSTSKIIVDNGIYKMWYLSTYNAGMSNIWYAESQDGKVWQNIFNKPVFTRGVTGSWDDYTVGPGAILKEGDQYVMYYNGWQSQGGKWQIGVAFSSDGINWQRSDSPILIGDSVNNIKVTVQSVLKVNNTYYMYYTSHDINNYDKMIINLATSSDGIKWNKYQNNPILIADQSWEGIGISFPAVIFDNGQFIMIYQNTDRSKFGVAYSGDGKNWTKRAKYIFSISDTKNNPNQIDYPFLVKSGNEYRLYYSAVNGSNIIICLATALSLK